MAFITANFGTNLNEMINHRYYEKILCKILNDSKGIFDGKFEQVEFQSNNEPDFIKINAKNGECEKYDAKILFTEEQCHNISKGIEQYNHWINSMLCDNNQFAKNFMERKFNKFADTNIYKTFSERLLKVDDDQNAILFIPFPIVYKIEKAIFQQFASDKLEIIYQTWLNQDKKNIKKNVYIIYAGFGDSVLIRHMNTGKKEEIKTTILSQYISYQLVC